MDFQQKTLYFAKRVETVKLNLFDTAGEEKYNAITACHYRKAKGAVIVYDVTNRQSFENLDKWLTDVRELTDYDCSVMVLGNKNDCDMTGAVSQREVTAEEGIDFAHDREVSFFEVSAYEYKQIARAFQELAEQILNAYQLDLIQRELSTSERNTRGVELRGSKRGRFECCVSGGRQEGETPQNSCC